VGDNSETGGQKPGSGKRLHDAAQETHDHEYRPIRAHVQGSETHSYTTHHTHVR
jgi:hypothetical protein